MKDLIFATPRYFLFIAGLSLVCAACKPRDENTVTAPATSVTPVPTHQPATNESMTNQPAADFITPEDAKNYVGKDVVVRGNVDRVHVSQKGDVFIDMGGRHPNAPFTAVCFKQAIPTDQLQALIGKIISVKGKVKEYNGRVEIILENSSQISQ